MSVYARVRPHQHVRRAEATWCGIKIHKGVSLLKAGVNAAAITARVCRRCTKAQAAAGRQTELPLESQRATVKHVGNMNDILSQACGPRGDR